MIDNIETFLRDHDNVITDYLGDHIVPIIGILLGAYLARKVLMMFVERFVRRTIRSKHFKTAKDEQQREDTIISILRTAMRAAIWLVAGLMILSELGLNIGPLLAGAGVLGVALGFGAQSMVKDYLAGIFIIAENQYRVGDVLQVNQEVSGIVERVSLRATVLRDLNGMVHYVPNGYIQVATNMTMEFANVHLNINVGYETDVAHLEQVINEVGKSIVDDPDWKDVALEAPHMLRVEAFSESALTVKVVCKTAPIRQWDVKSEVLRRLKPAFEKADIRLAYPQVIVQQAEKPTPKSAKR